MAHPCTPTLETLQSLLGTVDTQKQKALERQIDNLIKEQEDAEETKEKKQ